MAEVREAAVAMLGGVGADLALWGVDPVALINAAHAALLEMQPSRSPLDQALIPRSLDLRSFTARRQPVHGCD